MERFIMKNETSTMENKEPIIRSEIIKLLEDKDFVQKIVTMEDVEEVKKSFKNKGVEISDNELNELGAIMNEIIEILNKMPEEELNSVSGGAELRSSNIWGANLIRKAVGYKPAQYSDKDITQTSGGGLFGGTKTTSSTRELLAPEKITGSKFKDFVGQNANEIALGTMAAVGTAAIVGGAFGAKKLLNWYKTKYSKNQ